MKITVEKDDGTKQVFQGVMDYALVVRQWIPVMVQEQPREIPVTASFSHHSGGLRELLKEMRQAEVDLQRALDDWAALVAAKG